MSELAVKMQQDLEKKFDHLCFIRDQSKLHLANEFYEIRNSIDIDSEQLLARFRDAALQDESDEVVKVNKTREEFVGILQELEKRYLTKLPLRKNNSRSFQEAHGDLELRVKSFKDCREDQLKDAYIELATELLDEIYLLEKRLLGEYTIAYISSSDKSQLGHLLYISEDRLRRHEIDSLPELKSDSFENFSKNLHLGLKNSFVVECSPPLIVNKNYMILQSLVYYLKSTSAALLPKFVCMAGDEMNYTGYFAENSSIHKQMLGYRLPSLPNYLGFERIGGISSDCDLLAFSPEHCKLRFHNCQLKNLDFLASSHRHRLENLSLHDVSIEVFDGDCISRCVNLRYVFILGDNLLSNLEFLRPLKKITTLHLSFRKLNPEHLNVLSELEHLTVVRFVGTSTRFQRPKMNAQKVFEKLSTLPRLDELCFYGFEIDSIGKRAFAEFRCLHYISFKFNTIGFIDDEAFKRDGTVPLTACLVRNTF